MPRRAQGFRSPCGRKAPAAFEFPLAHVITERVRGARAPRPPSRLPCHRRGSSSSFPFSGFDESDQRFPVRKAVVIACQAVSVVADAPLGIALEEPKQRLLPVIARVGREGADAHFVEDAARAGEVGAIAAGGIPLRHAAPIGPAVLLFRAAAFPAPRTAQPFGAIGAHQSAVAHAAVGALDLIIIPPAPPFRPRRRTRPQSRIASAPRRAAQLAESP